MAQKYDKNANVTLKNAMRLVLSLSPNHPPTSASTKLSLTKVKMEISRRFTKNLVEKNCFKCLYSLYSFVDVTLINIA